MRKLECPGCGASLELKEDNRDFAFCEYCGAKITLDDYRSIHRIVDEAQLKHEETQQMIKLKQFEVLNEYKEQEKKKKTLGIKIFLSCLALSLLFLILGSVNSYFFIFSSLLFIITLLGGLMTFFPLNSNTDDRVLDAMIEMNMENKIRVPSGVFSLNTNYEAAKTMLEQAGFSNIKCIALNDLKTNIFTTPDTIQSITINGKNISSEPTNKLYDHFSPVIIQYHSMAENNASTFIYKIGQTIKDQFTDDDNE